MGDKSRRIKRMRGFSRPVVLAGERGFSLIELMIAMGIAVILSSALAAIFSTSVQTRSQIDRDGQKIENGRYAIDVISNEVRMAGFLAGYAAPSTTTYAWVDPCETAVANLGWNGTTNPVQMPHLIFGYKGRETDGSIASPTVPACLTNYKSGTDILTVRRTSSTFIAAADAVSSNTYMQASDCIGQTGFTTETPFVVNTTGFTLNQLQNDSGTIKCLATATKKPIAQMFVRTYYVASCNTCSPSDGVPTLKVAELSPGAISIRSLAPGIEQLHFEYGLDTSSDGAVDGLTYTLADNNTATANVWPNVVAAKIYVVARNQEKETESSFADTKAFTLGQVTVPAATGTDRLYKRKSFSSTVKLINRAGLRER